MTETYREFRDQMEYFIFDIQEIHPTDGWQGPANERDEVLFTQSTSPDERVRMAAV